MPVDMRLSLLYDVHRVAYLTDQLVERALEGYELSGTEFALYSFLEVHGPVTVTDVASGIAAPLARTSKLLARVEERGHLVRRPNPEDGRSILVELNDAGRKAHTSARPSFLDALVGVERALGSSIDDVRWALARLDDALSTSLETPPSARRAKRPSERSLGYTGDPLTANEEAEALRFIDWLRWQREDA
jgi:DNA-binding MarR family transcriptional regulator